MIPPNANRSARIAIMCSLNLLPFWEKDSHIIIIITMIIMLMVLS